MEKKILIGSPIHQKPAILKEFLESLANLKHDQFKIGYMFIDDNDQIESSRLLEEFAAADRFVRIIDGKKQDDYSCDENTHYWDSKLVWKVADFKDRIIQTAAVEEYDYLFLVDSDILLYPDTVQHLAGVEKDIISEIFWTEWYPGTQPLPNVWLYDSYDMTIKSREENLSKEEAAVRQALFLQILKRKGIYKVGMLGACTLLSRKALLTGVSFKPIYNLTFWGEDRHFCVRAAALGFEMLADTNYPAYHIYRESDLSGVEGFKRNANYRGGDINL